MEIGLLGGIIIGFVILGGAGLVVINLVMAIQVHEIHKAVVKQEKKQVFNNSSVAANLNTL